jgi:hypothetical protein
MNPGLLGRGRFDPLATPYFKRSDDRSKAVFIEMNQSVVILGLHHEPILVAAGRRDGWRAGPDGLPPHRTRIRVFGHLDVRVEESLQRLAMLIQHPKSIPIETHDGLDFLVLVPDLKSQGGLGEHFCKRSRLLRERWTGLSTRSRRCRSCRRRAAIRECGSRRRRSCR